MHFAFSTGFNIACDPDIDIHALQRVVDHVTRLMDHHPIDHAYTMEVEFSTGRVTLRWPEIECLLDSYTRDTVWIVDGQERHRLAVVPTREVYPQSQHATAPAMDVPVQRPTHVTIHTRRGPARITSATDLPALRRWFEANILDGEELAIPARDVVLDLPDAGRVHLGPDEIRRLGAALVNARQIERGAPLRAVANVDGQNYEQGEGEALPDYEQRVIQDIMLRRGRDLMRERGLTPQEAADEVRRVLAEQGVERLAQDMHQVQEPTDEVDRRLRTLTQEEHQTLAQAVAEYYIVDVRSAQAQELIDRVGLTEPMIRWFNVQIVESMNRLPTKEMAPSLMEVWRD